MYTLLICWHFSYVEQGYWRAAQAHKGLKQVKNALDATIAGYGVSLSQDQEDDLLSFLVEIVTTIISLRREWKILISQ